MTGNPESQMLSPILIPGLLITATDTSVGKTLVAGAIADYFRRRRYRVAVAKPVATGCVHRREGLVSQDAEFLAHCADARHPLDLIAPQRYAEALAPAIAAQRAKQPLDWSVINRSLQFMCQGSDVIIVEGIGGLMVPMDEHYTFLDVAKWLALPTLIVARPSLGTINHTLLTLALLRQRNVKVAGVVINRYPTDTPSTAEETNPSAIEKWGHIPILAILPDEKIEKDKLPLGVIAAIESVDWLAWLTH
jgi:dethiobiotin synthetase